VAGDDGKDKESLSLNLFGNVNSNAGESIEKVQL